VLQGLVIAGIEISFALTSKSASDEDDDFADLYTIKWSFLMIPPITVIILNLIGVAVGVCRTIYGANPQWGQLLGGVFFSFWVLAHLYPFAKGLMGRHERTSTVVYVWSGLIAISICLLWVVTNCTNNRNCNSNDIIFLVKPGYLRRWPRLISRPGWQDLPKRPSAEEKEGRTPNLVSDESMSTAPLGPLGSNDILKQLN